MKRILERRTVEAFLLLVLILSIAFLGRHEVKAEARPRLAAMPFFVDRAKDPGRGAVCPICRSVYKRGSILPGSENTLLKLLYEKIGASGRFHVLPLERVEEVLSHSERAQLEQSPVPFSIEMAKNLDSDFIMLGFLFRFEERIGSSIGAEKPASVGFDLHLFRRKDGKEVWKGRFDETQRPLTDNLLKIGSFLRRKASWVTAEELAGVGMEETLRGLPGIEELEKEP